ncbi:MAG: hypothetical protein AAFN77_12750 [Planctomycetota bacterium]
MQIRNAGVYCVLVCILFACLAPQLEGQEFVDDRNAGSEDVSISAGYALSLQGFKPFCDIQLVDDDTGLEYDVFSLARESSITESAGLNESQLEKIHNIKLNLQDELSGSVAEAAFSDDSKSLVADAFLNAQNEAYGLMTDEQRVRFEQASAQFGIRQLGWKKYLETIHPEIELKDQELNQLNSINLQSNVALQGEFEKCLIAANKELIQALPQEAQSNVESLQASQTERFDAWLKTPMVAPGTAQSEAQTDPDRVRKKAIRNNFPLDWARSIVYSRKVQASLSLSSDQLDQIKAIRAQRNSLRHRDAILESNDLVQSALNQEQLELFSLMVWNRQAKRQGTITEIAYGEMARSLKLNDEQANQMFDQGQQIYQDMLEQIDTIKANRADKIKSTINALAPETRAHIVDLIGDEWIVD